jgi:hypothetical protein
MPGIKTVIAFFAAVLTGTPGPQIDQQMDVMVQMRDGVQLSANVFRPSPFGRWPALLVRTPYGKGDQLTAHYRAFVEHGYAVVVQDVRGRFKSEGIFRPLEQEGPDGEDTIRWMARQPWCDGNIGMFGGSYLGMAQWQAALRRPPHLKAIFPGVSGDDDYADRFYSRGGAMKLGHRLEWLSENLRLRGLAKPDFRSFTEHLPLRTADRAATGRTIDFYQRSLDHPAYDSFWRRNSTREKLERIDVPVFIVGGWFDNYAQSDLEAFTTLRRLGKIAYILMGPWPHSMSDRLAGVDFGPVARVALRTVQFAWFDHWLKGKNTLAETSVARYFTMGENKWHNDATWPPQVVEIRSYYLGGNGRANSIGGNGRLQLTPPSAHHADHFTYDPRKPVPTRGGPVCCNIRLLPPGPMDQRPVERRADVLVYTSPPLKHDLEVTGPVRAVLYVSTSAPDTDFTAKLVDVAPDGAALSLTDGILRLRYRSGLDRVQIAHPGETYSIAIDTGVTSNVFRTGHKIRLEVSSSNFPRFDRNPNTGRPIADETQLRSALQTVHHGGGALSALLLPVVRRNSAGPPQQSVATYGRQSAERVTLLH